MRGGATTGLPAAAHGRKMSRMIPLLPCPFHALTGLPCPLCGSTHALLALAHGDLRAAFGWNPLATVLCLLAPVLVRRPVAARFTSWIAYALAVNWAWLLLQAFGVPAR